MFHHADSALFVAAKRRAKAVVEDFLGEWRPEVWLSDRYAGQFGWASGSHISSLDVTGSIGPAESNRPVPSVIVISLRPAALCKRREIRTRK